MINKWNTAHTCITKEYEQIDIQINKHCKDYSYNVRELLNKPITIHSHVKYKQIN